MYVQPALQNLAESVGLKVSLYSHEANEKVGVGCDILDRGEVIHQLSTLEFELTHTVEEASLLIPLLVSHASVVIYDFSAER